MAEIEGRPSQPDQKVGIEFVDILFALVVGEALDVLTRSGHMPAFARAHLAFASLLTITSWIGYHRSVHRYTGEITFDLRRPRDLAALGKFAIDVSLVVLYWLAVRTVEYGFSDGSHKPSWRPEILIAVASFALYCAWDWLAWIGGPQRGHRWASARRMASMASLMSVAFVAAVVALIDPSSSGGVTAVDGVLIVIVLAYRIGKDTFTPSRG